MPLLAVGGGQGNVLFLAVTGFLLHRRVQQGGQPLPAWLGRRYARILPLSVAVAGAWVAFRFALGWSATPTDVLVACLNRFWFVWAIALYYPAYYLVFSGDGRRIRLGIEAYLALYCLIALALPLRSTFLAEAEGFSPYKVYYYFSAMLVGGCVARALSDPTRRNVLLGRERLARHGLLVVLGLLVWGIEYSLVRLFGTGLQFQFLIHAGNVVFGAGALLVALSLEERVAALGWPQALLPVARATLEIYLFQMTVMVAFRSLPVPFPLNVPLFFVTVFVGGILLKLVADHVGARLLRTS